ncbi:hypothetical protein IIA15_07475 [candidate division TA06 bacterium]|nr:hypothetical protein [candidate division TA06 bacterium]
MRIRVLELLVVGIFILACGQRDSEIAPSTTAALSPTKKSYARFEDLRAAFLSNAQIGRKKADVEAHVGVGERVVFSNPLWEPPRVAFSYVPADKPKFHYVVVYENDIVVEQCAYTIGENGQPNILMP